MAFDPMLPLSTWTVPNGDAVTLRPIRPSDLAIETAFVGGLSPSTSYHRLLSPRNLSDDELRRFTSIDYARHMALVAIIGRDDAEAMIAVARYVRDESGAQAEFAIVVGDAWQGSGVGSRLLGALIDTARAAGVRRLSDVTLAHNQGMLALARKLGFTLRRETGDATLTRLTLSL